MNTPVVAAEVTSPRVRTFRGGLALRSSRVPAVYLTWANQLFLMFLAFSRISKLRGISGGQNSDSPHLASFGE